MFNDDWANDPPAGLVAGDCNFDVSKKWSVGIEGIHISNALDGFPFNNNPESSVDYYVGAYVKYVIWRK